MSPIPKLSVVVPNLNGEDVLGSCLESLQRQTFNSTEVLVVDNASTDGSMKILSEAFPEVITVRLEKNLGFAGGVNEGIQRAKGEFIALLNNDTVADPNWIERSVARLEGDSRIGAVTAHIVKQEENALDSTGNSMSTWGIPFPRDRDVSDDIARRSDSEVFAISGAGVVFRREVFDRVGSFDPTFFMYYEDVDLSFRARLAGFRIAYEPGAIIYHSVGKTSGGGYTPLMRYHSVKNSWALYLKNMPGTLLWSHLPRFLAAQLLILGNSIRLGLVSSHLRGLGRALLSLPSTVRARREIQHRRVVAPGEISRLLTPGLPPSYRSQMKRLDRATSN